MDARDDSSKDKNMNIDMCAKCCGAWDRNDLDMDLRMSAGLVSCYDGTPKFGPFFPIIWSFWIFLVESTYYCFFFCIEEFLLGTTQEKIFL